MGVIVKNNDKRKEVQIALQSRLPELRKALNLSQEEFADLIEKCIFDNTLSEKLKDGARKYYRETLNWNSWRKEFDKITEGVVIE